MIAKDNNTRNLFLIVLIIVAAVFRVLAVYIPALSNFTPVGAIALFGGVYFKEKWKGYVVVLATLFFTDILINYLRTSTITLGYTVTFWVYVSFILMVWVGSLIKKVNVQNILLASTAPVLIHWLLTDFPGDMYPHTLAGYGQSLVAAIPFEYNLVYGTLVFSAILFGGFELAKTKYTVLQDKKQLAL
ncbi:hypothetical protein LX99_01498 [Mucilaginibacter oryzae]|uniref:Uncharacterized protein n=1 Tax=Mucilaginibacter oryzae TaxID=468058 RepID=A0A316HVQ8_9SPHI|nr:DUF6580 family putative transport protein [Mucilaginibacter oryzae]PWK79042.1 hypothetical protein LX99_01498 [Mucilaginibacter oryzae]